ncbi:MAG: hypothetical protein GY847_40505 [Proteobacteria bacterium]|nr:hypothetical protein [Pseudomonadota bacterium]
MKRHLWNVHLLGMLLVAGLLSFCDRQGLDLSGLPGENESDTTETTDDKKQTEQDEDSDTIDDTEDTEESTGQDTDTQSDDQSQTDSERPSFFTEPNSYETTPYAGFYAENAHGTINADSRRLPGIGQQTSVDVEFYELNGPIEATEENAYIVRANGIDTCSLGLLPVISFNSEEEATIIHGRSAGDVTFHHDSNSYRLEKAFINEQEGSVRYYAYDLLREVFGFYDAELSITATGDETPAIPVGTVSFQMPPEYKIIRPRQGSEISYGPITLTWTSNDAAPEVIILFYVFLKANESEYGYEMLDVHLIRCIVTNDGDFIIPSLIMNQLPSGYSMNGGVYRIDVKLHEVTEDFRIQTIASSSAEIDLSIP